MIYVIGIGIEGAEGLGEKALKIIRRAGLVAGGRRHIDGLSKVDGAEGKRFYITSDLPALEASIRGFIRENRRSTVAVLATGDPLLYGIGNYIIRKFGKAGVRVIPGVSIIHEAFARIKESSAGLKVLSLHGRKADFTALSEVISSNQSVALFTDSHNTPDRVARGLLALGLGGVKVYVCEAIGYKDERVRSGGLKSIAKERFTHPLSVMIFFRKAEALVSENENFAIGLDDELFRHSANMITKSEIRALSISKLALPPRGVIWDIGSCTGSVAIETARLSPGAIVYAVEKNKKRVLDIRENISRFNVKNVRIISGEAPACMKGVSAPSAVFIGGGGAAIVKILAYVLKRIRPGGAIVVNAVTMETASRALEFFKKKGLKREFIQLNLARGKEVAGLNILSACNPVFILKAVKG